MLPFSQLSLPVQIATSFVPYLRPRRCFYALEPPKIVAATVAATVAAVAAVAVAKHFPTSQTQANPKMHMKGQ